MFNILSLSGGGKEQRCRVGRLEESSVANSIVNIIPYHLLPVKAQAKFVLRRTHGSPVAKKQRDTEWATRAPWSTLPWKLCQLLRRLPSSNTHKKKALLKMSAEICDVLLCIREDSRAAQYSNDASVWESRPLSGKISGFVRRAKEGEEGNALRADICESVWRGWCKAARVVNWGLRVVKHWWVFFSTV